jgi:peptidoglycan/LPS O-acetylase OafA/YrhL
MLDKKISADHIHYPALDGLRGIAIVLVILYHNFDFVWLFRIGWIGVDLFFVLSGFLITGILLKEKEGANYPGNFYMRRVLRIFPIYYLIFILFVFVLPGIVTYPVDIGFVRSNQGWFWFFLQNWLVIFTHQINNGFLDHFWSLGLEEQFYLLWPWIIFLLKSPQRIIRFLIIVLTGLLLLRLAVWAIQIKDLNYIALFRFTRIDALCVGGILAVFRFQGHKTLRPFDKKLLLAFFIVVLIILPLIKLMLNWKLPYEACCLFPLFAVFFGMVLQASFNVHGILFKALNNILLKSLGKISYGLYLFHYPVYRLLSPNVEKWFDQSAPISNLLGATLSAAAAIVLAVISYYCIEVHFLKLKRFFPSSGNIKS